MRLFETGNMPKAVSANGLNRSRKHRKCRRYLRASRRTWVCIKVSGGDKRDRTADLLHAMQALSQLSYAPVNQVMGFGQMNAQTRVVI
jgi:hypothetical protein